MKMPIKAAAFDLDGTLLDTSVGVLTSIRYAIEKFGLPMLADEQLRTFLGPPVEVSFARYYELTPEQLKELSALFREQYKTVDLLKAVPYEGIYDVLENLCRHGIKPVAATYKRQDYAVRLLKHYHFDDYMPIMYGSDFEGKLKKKDILEKALRDAGVTDFREAVMIGDSDNDALGAEAIGVPFIGVTYGFGFHSKEDVYQFPAIAAVDTMGELTQLLTGDQI